MDIEIFSNFAVQSVAIFRGFFPHHGNERRR